MKRAQREREAQRQQEIENTRKLNIRIEEVTQEFNELFQNGLWNEAVQVFKGMPPKGQGALLGKLYTCLENIINTGFGNYSERGS